MEDAVAEVVNFHRVYHSMRYVRGDLVLRLHRALPENVLDAIREQFADIVVGGTYTQTGMLPQEANEPELAHLTRLRFRFDRHGMGRLRQLIDYVNANG